MTFAFACKEGDDIIAVGAIAEHRINTTIVWELLWFNSLTVNCGHGTKSWSMITKLSNERKASAILVPSTNRALPFWLKVKTINTTRVNYIIRSETKPDDIYLYLRKHNIQLKFDYSTSRLRKLSKAPYRWTPSNATHVWFLIK